MIFTRDSVTHNGVADAQQTHGKTRVMAVARMLRHSLLIVMSCMTYAAHGQLCATATVTISARLPGYVRLSQSDVPLIVEIHNGRALTSDVPLQITWNLNPDESQMFRVTGVFRGTGLLQTDSEVVLPASNLQARLDPKDEYRPLMNIHPQVLYIQRISAANRKGTAQIVIQFQIDPESDKPVQDGKYYALVHFEAETL